MTPSISLPRLIAVRARTLLALLTMTLIAVVWSAAAPAHAESSAEGANGQVLIVSQSEGLDPEGTEVTVAGTGYDESKGIYVAVCVDNGPGERPTPCIGGVDTTGASSSNGWISSNPPNYGKDLVTPFGPDGSFEFDLLVTAGDDKLSCLDPAVAPEGCVLTTYADHTRLDDRSADVAVPLTFGEPGAAPEEDANAPTEETTSPEATETPSAEATSAEEPTSEATTPDAAATDTDETQSGTPAEFWLWLGLAAVALIGAVLVIQNKARKVRAREAAEAAEQTDGGNPDA